MAYQNAAREKDLKHVDKRIGRKKESMKKALKRMALMNEGVPIADVPKVAWKMGGYSQIHVPKNMPSAEEIKYKKASIEFRNEIPMYLNLPRGVFLRGQQVVNEILENGNEYIMGFNSDARKALLQTPFVREALEIWAKNKRGKA